MALESKLGQMGQGMRDFGDIIKHVDEANFGTWMETFLKVNGLTIRLMAMASMSI